MEKPRIGQELLDVPMGDMIRQMAFAIAEAQMKLDANSIDVAEMMGGLKTITDDDGNVTFEDSRVYFGKEKTTLQEAIELHNLSNDFQLRASIRQALGDANYEATNLVVVPAAVKTLNLLVSSAANNEVDKVYKISQDSPAPIEYYKYVGMSSGSDPKKIYEKVSEYSYLIQRKGSLAPASTINIPQKMSMLELGFTPTFYQFVDTIIEVKIAIKYTQESSSEVSVATQNRNVSRNLRIGFRKAKSGTSISTSQVNATYSQKYSYSAEGSSLLRTKLVPIPPPAILEERIRKMLEMEFEAKPTVQA
jgi:hypothetical protein